MKKVSISAISSSSSMKSMRSLYNQSYSHRPKVFQATSIHKESDTVEILAILESWETYAFSRDLQELADVNADFFNFVPMRRSRRWHGEYRIKRASLNRLYESPWEILEKPQKSYLNQGIWKYHVHWYLQIQASRRNHQHIWESQKTMDEQRKLNASLLFSIPTTIHSNSLKSSLKISPFQQVIQIPYPHKNAFTPIYYNVDQHTIIWRAATKTPSRVILQPNAPGKLCTFCIAARLNTRTTQLHSTIMLYFPPKVKLIDWFIHLSLRHS